VRRQTKAALTQAMVTFLTFGGESGVFNGLTKPLFPSTIRSEKCELIYKVGQKKVSHIRPNR
jgi:hypothetical protein